MITLIERTRGEFRARQESYDFLIGDKESCSQFYEFEYCNGIKKLLIGLIHNYPNMDLDPQVEIKDNRLIIGNNETLTIINIETKEVKEYPVLPVFYKFLIIDTRIIVMSELTVFCIIDGNIGWSISFDDMISFERLQEQQLIVSTYEDHKEICIDLITGQRREIK